MRGRKRGRSVAVQLEREKGEGVEKELRDRSVAARLKHEERERIKKDRAAQRETRGPVPRKPGKKISS